MSMKSNIIISIVHFLSSIIYFKAMSTGIHSYMIYMNKSLRTFLRKFPNFFRVPQRNSGLSGTNTLILRSLYALSRFTLSLTYHSYMICTDKSLRTFVRKFPNFLRVPQRNSGLSRINTPFLRSLYALSRFTLSLTYHSNRLSLHSLSLCSPSLYLISTQTLSLLSTHSLLLNPLSLIVHNHLIHHDERTKY